MKKIKRIGVLTSGGDAPGMNAAVRAVARTALANGIECIGIRRGWQGLINCDFVQRTRASVGHLLSKGGTILYTARSEEFKTPEGRQKALATCKMLGLDGIVAIGGDGTFRGALELSRLGVPVVGVPGTIDNDIGCTNYTIGFDSACNTAIECIDKLRDTMQSHERCSVVEVMGRNAGFLALYVGTAVGATAVLTLPTYFILQNCSATGDSLTVDLNLSNNFFDFLGRMMVAANPNIRDGMANVYCGLLIVLLLPLFFMLPKSSSCILFSVKLINLPVPP